MASIFLNSFSEVSSNGFLFIFSQFLEDLQRLASSIYDDSSDSSDTFKIEPDYFSAHLLGGDISALVNDINAFEETVYSYKESGETDIVSVFKEQFDTQILINSIIGDEVYAYKITAFGYNYHDGLGELEFICNIPELYDSDAAYDFNCIIMYYSTSDSDSIPLGIFVTGRPGYDYENIISKCGESTSVSYSTDMSYSLRVSIPFVANQSFSKNYVEDSDEISNLAHTIKTSGEVFSNFCEKVPNDIETAYTQANNLYYNLITNGLYNIPIHENDSVNINGVVLAP